ncbi:hypothetical protein CFP56_014037 [Quercus suber]|uniref:Uncharacterized protein n=1 Tax=Quercus suber TaxID=58331 RepID=A0AAW0KTM2_QUESU
MSHSPPNSIDWGRKIFASYRYHDLEVALMPMIISNILDEIIEKHKNFLVAAQNMIKDPLVTKNLNIFGCAHKSIEEHNVRCEIRSPSPLFKKIPTRWSSLTLVTGAVHYPLTVPKFIKQTK